MHIDVSLGEFSQIISMCNRTSHDFRLSIVATAWIAAWEMINEEQNVKCCVLAFSGYIYISSLSCCTVYAFTRRHNTRYIVYIYMVYQFTCIYVTI